MNIQLFTYHESGLSPHVETDKQSTQTVVDEEVKLTKNVLNLHLHMMELLPMPPNHLQFHQNPEWLTFLVPAHPSCPGKEADKQVSNYAAKK